MPKTMSCTNQEDACPDPDSQVLATFTPVETDDLSHFTVETSIDVDGVLHEAGVRWAVSMSSETIDVDVERSDVPDFSVHLTRGMLNDLDDEERTAILNHLVLGMRLDITATNQDNEETVRDTVTTYLSGPQARTVLHAVFMWVANRLSL